MIMKINLKFIFLNVNGINLSDYISRLVVLLISLLQDIVDSLPTYHDVCMHDACGEEESSADCWQPSPIHFHDLCMYVSNGESVCMTGIWAVCMYVHMYKCIPYCIMFIAIEEV